MTSRNRWLLAAIFLLLATFAMLSTQQAKTVINTKDTTHSNIDTIERHLEIERHKQLLAKKRQPDSTLAEFTTDGCSGGLSVGWEYLADAIPHFQAVHGKRPACVE